MGMAVRAEAFKGMVGLSRGRPRLPEDAPLVGFDWYWLDLGGFWVALAYALPGSCWLWLLLAGSGWLWLALADCGWPWDGFLNVDLQ